MARYERTSRRYLPRNVTVGQTRQIAPRNHWKRSAPLHKNVTVRRTQKSGSFLSSGLGKLTDLGMKFEVKNLFKRGIDVGSRALTSEIGQKLLDKGIKQAPGLYNIGISKN